MRVPRMSSLLGAILLFGVTALSACGSDAPATQSQTGSADTAATQRYLQAAYDGDMGSPPSTPSKPKPGVTLWVMSCGEQVSGCHNPAAGVIEAGKAAGWQTKLCDGQLNPTGFANCVRQAISAKATVFIPIGIDCSTIKQPFEDAKAAGVTVVGGGGSNCQDASGKDIWATERLQLEGKTIKDYWMLNGKLRADWIIGKTGGQAKVLLLNFTDQVWGPWITEGFKKELATCSTCEIVSTLDVSNNDWVSNVAVQKFSAALLSAGTANAVSVPVDGWLTQGLAQAVMSSGRSDQLHVIGNFADKGNVELIRNNQGQDASVGYVTAWGAWGSVDEAIRVLNGEAPVVEGDGLKVMDADHNMPAAGKEFDAGVDFRSTYLKTWGLAS